jgi:lysozyme
MFEKLKQELEKDEGVVYAIYFDHLGYATFGIGHLITKNDPEYCFIEHAKKNKVTISKERVDEVFKKDIEKVLDDCRKVFADFDLFVEELKLIIANMMFNLGLTRFSKFKNFIKAIKDKDYQKAAREMANSAWYLQVPNRAKRLRNRIIKLIND